MKNRFYAAEQPSSAAAAASVSYELPEPDTGAVCRSAWFASRAGGSPDPTRLTGRKEGRPEALLRRRPDQDRRAARLRDRPRQLRPVGGERHRRVVELRRA